MLYRVKFRHAGPDPRVALRTDNVLSNAGVADIRRRLGRLDRANRNGPWTEKFLSLIDEPMVRAADLAEMMNQNTVAFKAAVRKLKNLGLTESLDVGYCISPRGRAVLKILAKEFADSP